MTTNVALGSTSKRLVELYTAVLGANVGLLPVLMVFLFREAELPNKLAQLPWRSVADSAADGKVTMSAELAFLLWALTTVIVIHEWWLSVNFFYEYDLDKGGVSFAAWQIVVNVIYLVPLLSLSALLFMEQASVSLVPYAAAIAGICLVDIFIVAPIWRSTNYSSEERKRAGRYLVVDLAAFIFYVIFVFYPMYAEKQSLFTIALFLAFIYGLTEFPGNHWLARQA